MAKIVRNNDIRMEIVTSGNIAGGAFKTKFTTTAIAAGAIYQIAPEIPKGAKIVGLAIHTTATPASKTYDIGFYKASTVDSATPASYATLYSNLGSAATADTKTSAHTDTPVAKSTGEVVGSGEIPFFYGYAFTENVILCTKFDAATTHAAADEYYVTLYIKGV